MYKGTITTPTPVIAGQDIPFTTVLNTNAKTLPASGAVNILSPGYWDAEAQIEFTAAAGDITISFFVDGVEVPETQWEQSGLVTTDVVTANLLDVLKIVRTLAPTLATVSVRLSVPATINRAVFVLQEIR